MSKRDRARPKARREAFRDPRPRVLFVTEGRVTEKQYLIGFEKTHELSVKFETADEHGTPMTLIKVAKARRNDAGADYDDVWCIFDRDEHPFFESALKEATDAGLELAVSNPCFELWLYLHFAEQPGAQSRKKVAEMLQKHVKGYAKHIDFSVFSQGLDEAVHRAERLSADAKVRDEDEYANPSTTMFRVIRKYKPK